MHSCVCRVRVMFSDWRKLMRISRLDFDISWGVCNTLHDNGETQGLSILSSDLTGERHRSTVAPLLIFTNLCALNLRVSNLSATFQSKPRHPAAHITISHPSDCTQMEKEYSSEYIPVTVSWWCWYGWAQCAAGDSICNDILAIDRLSWCLYLNTDTALPQPVNSVRGWSVNYDVQMFSCFHLRVSRGWRRIQLRRDEEMCVK